MCVCVCVRPASCVRSDSGAPLPAWLPCPAHERHQVRPCQLAFTPGTSWKSRRGGGRHDGLQFFFFAFEPEKVPQGWATRNAEKESERARDRPRQKDRCERCFCFFFPLPSPGRKRLSSEVSEMNSVFAFPGSWARQAAQTGSTSPQTCQLIVAPRPPLSTHPAWLYFPHYKELTCQKTSTLSFSLSHTHSHTVDFCSQARRVTRSDLVYWPRFISASLPCIAFAWGTPAKQS